MSPLPAVFRLATDRVPALTKLAAATAVTRVDPANATAGRTLPVVVIEREALGQIREIRSLMQNGRAVTLVTWEARRSAGHNRGQHDDETVVPHVPKRLERR